MPGEYLGTSGEWTAYNAPVCAKCIGTENDVTSVKLRFRPSKRRYEPATDTAPGKEQARHPPQGTAKGGKKDRMNRKKQAVGSSGGRVVDIIISDVFS